MDFFDAADKVFNYDEGSKDRPYKDSNNFWTIGKGHYIGTSLTDFKLPEAAIDILFQIDLAQAIRDARFAVGNLFFDTIPPARQMALVTLTFTLGRNKFLLFEETIDLMKKSDWDAVANHILKSKWSKDVDPHQSPGEGRDDRIAYMFRTGKFHPDYKIVE